MPDRPTVSAGPDAGTTADLDHTASLGPAASAGDPLPAAAERYTLGDEIARGGMGVVHRATDTTLDREVAVKVLQERFDAASGLARRFADEARITARLQHTGIPPVHDLGTLPDGRPFLAMKLIRGDTLAHLLAARPDPAADRGRFVAAFEQVCQAVAYAHARGVIHRDLKPANVMVGDYGEVQVMDWGLAKVLRNAECRIRNEEDTDPSATQSLSSTPHSAFRIPHSEDERLTQTGSVLGTPAYMPPEQAIGAVDKIDRRSDVFGLGGILAAVLTGAPPFDGRKAESSRQMAAKGQVQGCFARLDGCGADPELIALCKRCLAAEQDDRPADAGEVARAVAAFRAAAEERARRAELDRATAEVEAREQRKRRRVQLALAAAVGLFLLTAGAGALWTERRAAARALTDEQQAGERWAREARNRDALAARLDGCEGALRAGTREPAAAMLDEAEKRLPDGGSDEFGGRVAACRAAIQLLAEFDATDGFRWHPRRGKLPERAEVARRWAATFAGWGFVPGTTPPAEAARRVNESLVRERLLGALDAWLVEAPNPGLADVLRLADPDPYRDAIRAAVAARDAARVGELLGREAALGQPARFTVALGTLRDVPDERRLAVLKRAADDHPADLTVLLLLGEVRFDAPGADQSVRWNQAAVAAHPRNTITWHRLGNALHAAGRTPEAIAAFRHAIALDPSHPYNFYNLGTVLTNSGDHAGAVAAFREAIRLDPDYSPSHNNLGNALKSSGDKAGAVAAYREAVRLDEKNVIAHENLGRTLADAGDPDGAIVAYRHLLRVAPDSAFGHRELGAVLFGKGDKAGAKAEFLAAVAADPNDPFTHYNLGSVLAALGERPAAIAAFRESIRLGPKFSHAHNNLANALRTEGDRAGAIASYREAVRVDEKNWSAHFNLGITLDEDGDVTGAIAAYRGAIRANPKHASSRLNLGLCLQTRGDLDGAVQSLREAVRLAPTNPRYPPMLSRAVEELARRGPLVAPPPRAVTRP